MAKSDAEIIELFKTAVFEVDNKKLGEVTQQTSLASLGLDSVQTMEVIGAMEEKLNVQFPDEDLATLKSIGDLTKLVHRLSA
ncbi:MAG: acyl carrier protein [Myxococcota bacterium]